MALLRELQQSFAAALLGDSTSSIAAALSSRILPAEQSLAVYRNNVRETFIGALQASYPVLRRLVGHAYFRQLAAAYQRRYPSRSGNVSCIGNKLADYLETEYRGTVYDYFIDVARLEWACQRAAVAADGGALDRGRLAAIRPADYPRLCFALHPSVALLRSAYPLLDIWRDNQPGAEPAAAIDLGSGGVQLLARRDGWGAEVRDLDLAVFEFLSALQRSCNLTDAIERALMFDTAFDLAAQLNYWVRLGVIDDFSMDTNRR